MGKAEVILLIAWLSAVAFIGADFWLITHGYEQWSTQMIIAWTTFFGGELLLMAGYRSLKIRDKTKLVKYEEEEEEKNGTSSKQADK